MVLKRCDAEEEAMTHQVERLDRTQPPPGFDLRKLEKGLQMTVVVARVWGPRAVAAAWEVHEREHDPPGMWTRGGGRGDFASLGQFGVDGSNVSLAFDERWTRKDARAAAWAWYWRRVAVADTLDTESCNEARSPRLWWALKRAPVWPRCLAWSDEQLAVVERWLAEGGELPEVLRG